MTDDQNDRLDVPFSHDSLDETGNTAAVRINEVAESFEQAWRTGTEPNLDEFLLAQDVDRQQLLLELIRVDLEQRWRQGEPLRIEAYLSRYPELANKPADVVDLLGWECRVRRMLGQQVDVREFRERFPHHFAALMRRMGEPATVQHAPPSPPAAIRLNCPHCRNPIEVVAEQADEIVCPSCGSSFRVDNDRTPTWSKGKLPKLGKFELLTRLGMGAFGTVYKAHDSELKRTVAVKLPRSGTIVDEEDEQRFLREARSAAQLHHPGIVPVFEVGRSKHFVYIVSEFVDGITLADKLTAHRYTFTEAAQLIARVADAIEYSHRQGVIHRDLKPSNIMLSADGTPRVMDFGLAKRDAGEVTMTVEGAVLGTPAYMSPEQAAGHAHEVDGRSDVYSVGVMLYQLLTGEVPFRGNQRMLLHQVIHDEPRSPRSLNDRIPRDLETICLKCLSKERGRRYGTAIELSAELQRYLSGKPILARPVRRTERVWRWCRRNPMIAGLVTALMLILATGTLISTHFAIKANARAEAETQARITAARDRQLAIDSRNRAEQDRVRATEESRRAYRNFYIAQMNAAQRDWDEAAIRHLLSRLEKTRPENTGGEDLRGFEWYYWDRLCHCELFAFSGYGVAFSSDGCRIAYSADDGFVRVWDLRTNQEMMTLKGPKNGFGSVACSRDGRHIASAGADKAVHVWDARNGQEVIVFRGHTDWVSCIVFSPDGQRIATSDGTVHIWDMESGQEELKLKTNGRHGIYSMAFNPDGQHIAFGGDEGDIKICDSKIGQIIAVLKEAGSVSSCAYSPDGRHIVSAGLKNDLTIWDVKEVKKILSLEGHTNIVRSAVYSPDGQRIASVSDDRTLRIWDTQNGQTILMFKGHTEGVDTVVFSPDGRRVATAGRNVKVWDAWSGQEILTLNTDLDSRPAFNREGDRIASAEGDLIVWDAQTGEQLFQLKGKWPEKDWTDPDFRTEGDTPVSLEVFMEFSQDQSRIASMIDPTTIKIVDAREMREICRLKGHTQFIESVSFSPDGRCIATASYDNSVRLWNGETGQELHVLRPQTKTASNNLELSALRFSPDGSRIAFSSGERESVSSDGAVIEIWDALGGRQLLLLKGHKSLVPDLMFSPDGLRIASASWDESVRVWDAHNGQEIQSLNGHTDIVDAVAFSPDGRRIASAGRDHTMRIWDLESGQEVLALRGHSELRGRSDIFRGRSDINRSVAFDPDGRRIVSSSWDRTVKILDARTWTPELRAETESIGLINHKLETGTLKENLIEAIATDITISDKVRVVAQSLAERFQERPEALNGVSWMIVARPDHSQERYLWALRRAERACQLAPDDGNFLNTLGIAQFRVGDYAKAVDTLTRSENLNSKEYGQSIPADLAFLAMAQDELGRHHEAQEILQRLRTTITLPDFANDAESQGFLREAAERIETRRP